MRARTVLLAWLVWLLPSCGAASPVPLGVEGQHVDTGKLPPPPGARYLGPIEASHGSGCGLFAVKGSYDGALADLRNRAGQLGGNYVQIETVTEPHDDYGCTTGGFEIKGAAFFISEGPSQAEPGAPTAAPTSSPPAAPPTTPLPASPPSPPNPGVCDPPCSPGFGCHSGTCIPLCNPPCEAGEVCTRGRVCEKAPPPPAAPSASSMPPLELKLKP